MKLNDLENYLRQTINAHIYLTRLSDIDGNITLLIKLDNMQDQFNVIAIYNLKNNIFKLSKLGKRLNRNSLTDWTQIKDIIMEKLDLDHFKPLNEEIDLSKFTKLKDCYCDVYVRVSKYPGFGINDAAYKYLNLSDDQHNVQLYLNDNKVYIAKSDKGYSLTPVNETKYNMNTSANIAKLLIDVLKITKSKVYHANKISTVQGPALEIGIKQ